MLLSTAPDDISLYNKPMARNAQIWSHEYELLLDGPRATPDDFQHVADRLAAGGLFGYRMIYPAMRVGEHEVYWHRPLVAFRSPANGEAVLLPDAPLGYFTAYPFDKPRLDRAVELWPRLLDRPLHRAAVRLFSHVHENHLRQTLFNIRKLWTPATCSAGRWAPASRGNCSRCPSTRRWKTGSNRCRPMPATPRRPLRWSSNCASCIDESRVGRVTASPTNCGR